MGKNNQPPEATHLDPLEWASVALTAPDGDTAFDDIRRRIGQVIQADTVAFIGGAPLPDRYRLGRQVSFPAPTYLNGIFLSREWVEFMGRDGNGARDPMPKYTPPDEAPMFGWEGSPLFERFADEDKPFTRHYFEHGYHAGISIPHMDYRSGTFDSLGIHSRAPIREVRRFSEVMAAPLKLAHVYFCEAMRLRRLRDGAGQRLLSDRERDCLAWASAGLSTKEIADRLTLSDATVNAYFASSKRKLGARTRAQTCARAVLLSQIAP